MTRLALGAALILVAAACGGSGTPARTPAPPPRLPHDVAQAFAQDADTVAADLAAGDACGAREHATALQEQLIAAVNAHRVPARLLEPLSSSVNDLVGRIVCTPPPAAPTPKPAPQPKPAKGPKPPKTPKPHPGHGHHGGRHR
jgi:hypothetical protein